MLGELWESVLGCGEGKERCGGRALNELMRSLTFRAHMLDCEGRGGKVCESVLRCGGDEGRWGG